jgi:hypothetical protein
MWWPFMGVAASIGLVLYFVAATVSHLRLGNVKMPCTRRIYVDSCCGSTCHAYLDSGHSAVGWSSRCSISTQLLSVRKERKDRPHLAKPARMSHPQRVRAPPLVSRRLPALRRSPAPKRNRGRLNNVWDGERRQTGSLLYSDKPTIVMSKTSLFKRISENFPSVPNSARISSSSLKQFWVDVFVKQIEPMSG